MKDKTKKVIKDCWNYLFDIKNFMKEVMNFVFLIVSGAYIIILFLLLKDNSINVFQSMVYLFMIFWFIKFIAVDLKYSGYFNIGFIGIMIGIIFLNVVIISITTKIMIAFTLIHLFMGIKDFKKGVDIEQK